MSITKFATHTSNRSSTLYHSVFIRRTLSLPLHERFVTTSWPRLLETHSGHPSATCLALGSNPSGIDSFIMRLESGAWGCPITICDDSKITPSISLTLASLKLAYEYSWLPWQSQGMNSRYSVLPPSIPQSRQYSPIESKVYRKWSSSHRLTFSDLDSIRFLVLAPFSKLSLPSRIFILFSTSKSNTFVSSILFFNS